MRVPLEMMCVVSVVVCLVAGQQQPKPQQVALNALYNTPPEDLPGLLSSTFDSIPMKGVDSNRFMDWIPNMGTEDDLKSFSPPEHNSRRSLVYYAMSAYCNHFVDISKFTCGKFCDKAPKGTRVVHVINNWTNGASGFVAVNEQERKVLLVWEGSIDVQDWFVTNIRMGLVSANLPSGRFNGMKLHQGFLEAYRSVAGELEDILSDLLTSYPGFKLAITGHSLGGAMSIVSAIHLIDCFKLTSETLDIVTFGQPRVGNTVVGEFFKHHQVPVIRYVHKNDIIPHLPTTWQGYSHHHTEQWIVGSNVTNCLQGEDPSCSLSAIFLNMLDHANYLGVWWNPLSCK
jgi:hypothetical protein